MPVSLDPASMTLLILGGAIMLVLGAIRWLVRLTAKISGMRILVTALVIVVLGNALIILILAYLFTVKTA
ncbi:hypothetical protein Aph01nite_21490 [Acrocarpospora phusangensis]|uniref:DUF2768 domain-containing protein n=2 Tax=Acrocarpospora phusangensis TaxID=1070424 RepID=A0A919UJ90_9ACTN|nr:hypothetical protein Aph01nite_21490 [Acrocarpospora phusangensis]